MRAAINAPDQGVVHVHGAGCDGRRVVKNEVDDAVEVVAEGAVEHNVA
jgi:hypothetical protein